MRNYLYFGEIMCLSIIQFTFSSKRLNFFVRLAYLVLQRELTSIIESNYSVFLLLHPYFATNNPNSLHLAFFLLPFLSNLSNSYSSFSIDSILIPINCDYAAIIDNLV